MTGFASSFFFFLPSFLFPLLIKVSLSQPICFPTFVPPILFLTLLRIRREQAAVCCLAADQGQTTTIYTGGFSLSLHQRIHFLLLQFLHILCIGLCSVFFPFQLNHHFYPQCMLKFDAEFKTPSTSEFCKNSHKAEITRVTLILSFYCCSLEMSCKPSPFVAFLVKYHCCRVSNLIEEV